MTQPNPFFIVGSPRSGTTLLRFILSSHSRLYVPDETGFIPFLRKKPHTDLSLSEVDAILTRIGQLNRFWDGMVPDVGAFYSALPQPRLPFVLEALFQQRLAPHRAVRWGDKTPLYVRYVPTIRALFPQAKFIHMVRDGRDATLSAAKKWAAGKPYMDSYYLLTNWRRNVEAGWAAQKLLGDDYLELRYETLVTEPETAVSQLCTFLNEPFEPAMLDQTGLARQVGGGVDEHVEVQRQINSQSVGRWQQEMPLFEQKLANHLIGPTLQQAGYPLADVPPFTPTERLTLARLAAKFTLADTTRSLLYKTGLRTLNANRRK